MNTFQRLLRTSVQTASVEIRPDGVVTEVNPAFSRYVRVPPEHLVDQILFDFMAPSEPDRIRAWMKGSALPDEPTWVNFAARDGAPFTLRCLIERIDDGLRIVGEPELDDERSTAEEMMRLNNELATMARERARKQRELERVRAKLEATLEDLQTSFWHLQKIQEVLPICMGCGKIKAGQAQWQSVIDYLKENEIFLSHGYCPECEQEKLVEFGLE